MKKGDLNSIFFSPMEPRVLGLVFQLHALDVYTDLSYIFLVDCGKLEVRCLLGMVIEIGRAHV